MKVGIDLGTTFSGVAFCEKEGGNLAITQIELRSSDGRHQIPSVIYIPADGKPVVGSAALNMYATEPDRVFQWFKREMGEAAAGTSVDGRSYTPEELSAEVLKVLKEDTESWLDDEITGAVVCVPAWFGDRQREATRRAVEMSGIPLLHLMAEPSAAAIAAATERPDQIADRDVLVYDLGGGTFDVVLVRTKSGTAGNLEVDTLCRDGHFQLGGHDWDVALAEHLCKRCFELHGHNPQTSDDKREWPMLLEAVERSKRHYSAAREAVTFPVGLRGHAVEVTRETFNEVTAPLLDRTKTFLENVLKEGQESYGVKLDELVVIPCGGSSKLPGVVPMLTALVGHEPINLRRNNPETMVVRGAAYAAYLESEVNEIFRAVGIEAYRGEGPAGGEFFNKVIVPDGAAVDQKFTERFEIAEDDPTEMEVVIYQGDDEQLPKCERIGEVLITGLPKRKAGATVTVTLWYDSSGILNGSVQDDQTKIAGHVTIKR